MLQASPFNAHVASYCPDCETRGRYRVRLEPAAWHELSLPPTEAEQFEATNSWRNSACGLYRASHTNNQVNPGPEMASKRCIPVTSFLFGPFLKASMVGFRSL